MRKEHDLLGVIELEDEVYYGAQTARALQLVNPSKEKLKDYPELIKSITQIKKAAAVTHHKIGIMDEDISQAIIKACNEILNGEYIEQFPVDIFSGGGGISVHMNINEVIANRANEIITGTKGYDKVHPNTHVNMGQSTNDVLPSAMKMCIYENIIPLLNELEKMQCVVTKKCNEFEDVVKLARTCIQDAVPISMGQYLSGFDSFLKRQIRILKTYLNQNIEIPLGGTAVGTGLGSHSEYRKNVVPELAAISKLKIVSEENLFDGLQNADEYVRISAILKGIAFGLSKMGRDLRLLSSGPRGGFNEINLEAVQNGSSIMPGKVNPSLPELMNMVAYQIVGNDASVNMACEAGELELNVWEGVIIINLIGSCKLLVSTILVFADKCLSTMQVNEEKCKQNVENSLAVAMVLSEYIGYEKGCEVAEFAYKNNLSIRETVIKKGIFSEEKAYEILDIKRMCNLERN